MEHRSESFDEKSFPNWTIEEFDAIREDHTFSLRYRCRKRKAIREYRQTAVHRFSFRAAAAAAAAAISLPVCIYAAAAHTDFFRNAFGDAGRQSTASHEELVEDGKGGHTAVTYPEREYVQIDEEAAESLIGNQVAGEPIVIQINDHTLTINSAVRDENAIVMEFTIDCDTGVKALKYDALMNEGKGAGFSPESTFYFRIKNASASIYVDPDKTTDTSLHGYYYGLFTHGGPLADGKSPVLDIGYADVPYQRLLENAETDAAISHKTVDIPAAHAAEQTAFTSESGGLLELSPISMKIDMGKGMGLSQEDAYDPYYLETVSIEYKDGSAYQVINGPDHIDNTAYFCGGLGPDQTEIAIVFNRLVNPADIWQVLVNGISCKAVNENRPF